MDNEYGRLAALRAYEILDTPGDPILDRIATLSACVFGMPLACVSLVDSSRLFLKAAHGLDATELGREPGMCVTTVETNAPRQVRDLELDHIAAEHPLVAEAPNLRFYAGAPLRSPDGFAIGTLCVLDTKPRDLSEDQMDCLTILSELVMHRLEVHRSERERDAEERALENYGSLASEMVPPQPTGMMRLDYSGVVEEISRVAFELSGLRVGQHITAFPSALEEELERISAAWTNRSDLDGISVQAITRSETGLQTKILLQSDPVRQSSGAMAGHFITVRPLGARAELSRQAVQAQKLESLGALAGGIAHDFNNILAAIMGNVDLAVATNTDTGRSGKYLGNIDRSVERASALCDQLLAYSGGGQFTVSTLDLSGLVREMSGLLEISLSKKAALELDLAEEGVNVEGDPTQVRQVVMNVLTNASESLEGRSGRIALRTRSTELDHTQLSQLLFGKDLEPGPYVVFEVVDEGCGMNSSEITQVFDPLYSTKFSGHGLGMAAVAGIMRAHSGAIEITSIPNEGTTVQLYFPRTSQPAAVDIDLRLGRPAADRQGTVLVVEDERAIREVLVDVLETAGYSVLAAADGAEAINILEVSGDRIQAAVIDMMMPNVDGAELHQHLCDHDPSIQVVLTSGYNEREATRRLTAAGLVAFLKKPYRPDDLLRVLDEQLEDRLATTSRQS